jgi:selenocysteine lyase/cysteine desulfurase
LEKAGAIKLKIIPCDLRGFVPPEIIEETLNENIGAVVLNHSSNVIGTVQDAKAISALSKKHNIPFILDASQSAGSIDIDISDINPDIFVFTGHKSLFALRGTGGLYIKHDIELKPLITGGTGIQSDYMYQPEWRPVYYEAGTQNIPGIASLNAGVEFLKDTGKKLLNRKKDLFLNIVKFMLDDKRFILYGGKELSDFSSKIPVLSFNMKGLSPEDLGYMLEGSFGIIARTGLHCAPLIHKRIGSFPKGSVRISLSVFNTEEEIDALINALKEIVLTV